MSEKAPTIPIINIFKKISWPCGHELVTAEVTLSRHQSYIECPYCILEHLITCYEDDKDRLGDQWKQIIDIAKKALENS